MKNLIITGYSGAGKSVIGRNTAELLGFGFTETGERMTAVTGYSPAQVMKKYGLVRYRSEEELIFRKLAAAGDTVIAVDSLLCERERLTLLKPGGFFVLLRVAPELLCRRLQKRSGRKIQAAELARDIKRYEDTCLPLCDFVLEAGEYAIENAAARLAEAYRSLNG